MTPLRPAACGLVAALALGSLSARVMAQQGGGPPPANVALDAARFELVDQQREVTGTLRASARSVLAAEIDGRVERVVALEGKTLARGDVVAFLDPTFLELARTRARAELDLATGNLAAFAAANAKAERDLPKAARLHAELVVSDSVHADARTRLDETTAQLAAAGAAQRAAAAALREAEERLAHAAVRAPYDSVVVARRAQSGEWLRAGDPVAEVVASRTVEAWLDVPESLVGAVARGGVEVTVHVPAAAETARGPAVLVPDADLVARTFPVRVTLNAGSGSLRPGMSCTGFIPTGTPLQALTVHGDAVLRDDAGAFVYREAGGVAAAVRVEVLFGVGPRVAVRAAGLEDGALVVVDGNERLSPGQPLTDIGAQAAPGTGGN